MSDVTFLSKTAIEPVPAVECTAVETRTLHLLLSVLLDYPQEQFTQALAAIPQLEGDLPPQIMDYLQDFYRWADGLSLRQITEHYVDTFDQQRRCALYLSYYVAGDTRLRGSAILGFRDFAKTLGFEKVRDELDDYLPVILELSAKADDPLVWELLASHREGIEVMRSALHRAKSPYLLLLNALACTLPEITEEVHQRFQRLISQGPPNEMVGVHLPNPWSKQ